MASTNTYTTYTPNKTTEFFRKISLIGYISGLPNFWIDDLNLPKKFIKYYDSFTNVVHYLTFLFILLEWAAFFTQHDLDQKQKSDRVLFAFSHPVYIMFCTRFKTQQDRVKDVLFHLGVLLKKTHNNKTVEQQMIKRTMFFGSIYAFVFNVAMLFYGFDALIRVLNSEGTFVTVFTVYPDIHDASTLAGVLRVVIYIFWYMFLIRTSCVYLISLVMIICVGHQYRNLQSYFYSMRQIFDENAEQLQKEYKYEQALKLGLKLHSLTLWCTKSCENIINHVVTGQISVNITGLLIVLLQMMEPQRTVVNSVVTLATAATVLLSTGLFMWNAGDVTFEAAALGTALYSSGWEQCEQRAATRVRKLIVIAMIQGQVPVVFRSIGGVVELSYESYVSIVKLSYSVFSVLY